MSTIMSYSEFMGSSLPEGTVTHKIVGEDIVFTHNGKEEKITKEDLQNCDQLGFATKIKEAVTKLGATKIDKLEEIFNFGGRILNPGTDGTTDPKKGPITNALRQLFQKQKNHKTIWGVIIGDDENSVSGDARFDKRQIDN
jgi:hypothetical protein